MAERMTHTNLTYGKLKPGHVVVQRIHHTKRRWAFVFFTDKGVHQVMPWQDGVWLRGQKLSMDSIPRDGLLPKEPPPPLMTVARALRMA